MTTDDKLPEAWIEWARVHGSGALKRAIAENYPFASVLRRELVAWACPVVPGTERASDINRPLTWGDVREPNGASFALLDDIERTLATARSLDGYPSSTRPGLSLIKRVSFSPTVNDLPVLATGVHVLLTDGHLGQAQGAYIWSRSDR